MCRLFPCLPIFKGVFLLKVQKKKKKCVYVIMLKTALELAKNVFFDAEKGISESDVRFHVHYWNPLLLPPTYFRENEVCKN